MTTLHSNTPLYPTSAQAVTPSDTATIKPSIIYVGVGGNVKVTTAAGDDVTFTGILTGHRVPCMVIRVWATGTPQRPCSPRTEDTVMPSLTQSQTADVTVTADSTLTIQNPGGYATVESPVGTVVYGGGSASATVDIVSGTARITAVTGGLYYEVQTDPTPVTLTGSEVTAVRSLVSGARKLNAVSRLGGLTAGSTFSGDRTFCLKMEAEGQFDSVRIHLYHRFANAPTVFRALVAATETASLSSVAVAGQPTVGGAQTAALRSAVGQPGWAAVTWSGNATTDIPLGASLAPSVASSDWIELPSVDRADGGILPLLMVRLFHAGTTTGAQSLIGGLITDTSADQTAWQNAAANDWWREYQNLTITTTDGVTTPSTNVPGTTLGNSTPWMAIEFGYRNRAISVMGVGDSLTENTAFAFGGFGNWGLRGCMLASRPTRPVTWFNNGAAGQPNSVWLPAAETAIALHRPTHVLYQLLSPNSPDVASGVALTGAERALLLARLQRIARACDAADSRLVVWSGLPNNSYTLESDNFRKLLNSAAQATAESGGCDFLDLEATASTGASPARMVSSFDSTHPNNALLELMGLRLRDYLNSI